MSGPIDELDQKSTNLGMTAIEVREGRSTHIGQMAIARVLPTKNRRTIGPWCFVDLMQADDVERPPRIEIGPHPHIGLATVTWLFSGSVLHGDSLGTEQLIRPGQLNLMTAGQGIAHAEEGVDTDSTWEGTGIMGAQMWLAQTETTRHGPSAFQHLADLPETEVGDALAKVLIGEFGDAHSPAEFAHPTIGLDLSLRGPTAVPADPAFEHAVVPIDKPVKVDENVVDPGSLAIVPVGRDRIHLSARSYPARLMMLGGEPLGDRVKMWWNFVARTTDELTEAWHDWKVGNEDRFGPVPSTLERMDAPTPPWVRESDN
jgi:redox-sensitive bicupin YhaK (pirin superfamily)